MRVFDYVDAEVPVLKRMFEKRLRTYRAVGYARDEAPLGYSEPADEPRAPSKAGTMLALGNPDLHDPNNIRLDYTPMPFDANPRTPYRWPLQPWFIEKNSVHGNGNLIMFTNGSIREALDLIPKSY